MIGVNPQVAAPRVYACAVIGSSNWTLLSRHCFSAVQQRWRQVPAFSAFSAVLKKGRNRGSSDRGDARAGAGPRRWSDETAVWGRVRWDRVVDLHGASLVTQPATRVRLQCRADFKRPKFAGENGGRTADPFFPRWRLLHWPSCIGFRLYSGFATWPWIVSCDCRGLVSRPSANVGEA